MTYTPEQAAQAVIRGKERIEELEAQIQTLEARVAAGDKLADAASEQVQYMQMCNDTGDLERNLRAALADYQATKEGEA